MEVSELLAARHKLKQTAVQDRRAPKGKVLSGWGEEADGLI